MTKQTMRILSTVATVGMFVFSKICDMIETKAQEERTREIVREELAKENKDEES